MCAGRSLAGRPDFYPSMKIRLLSVLLLLAPLSGACAPGSTTPAPNAIKPRVVTEPTKYDTDDPAFWINPTDRAKSLVIGTDKDSDGALYVYDLDGKIVNRVGDLKRPNNVDVAYGFLLGGKPTDIAVTTERELQRLRVFSVPDMKCVDKGALNSITPWSVNLLAFESKLNRTCRTFV